METCRCALIFSKFGTLIFAFSWRSNRRAAHEMFTKEAVRTYHPVLCKEAIYLASAILENVDILDEQFKRTSASAMMSILYNYPTIEKEHDNTLAEIHAFVSRVTTASAPGAHLVEFFPWMIHIPERSTLYHALSRLIT